MMRAAFITWAALTLAACGADGAPETPNVDVDFITGDVRVSGGDEDSSWWIGN